MVGGFSPRIPFLTPSSSPRIKPNRASSYAPPSDFQLPPPILLKPSNRRMSDPNLPRPRFDLAATTVTPPESPRGRNKRLSKLAPTDSPKSRPRSRSTSQSRQTEEKIEHEVSKDYEVDAMVISHSIVGPRPVLPSPKFGAGFGWLDFDRGNGATGASNANQPEFHFGGGYTLPETSSASETQQDKGPQSIATSHVPENGFGGVYGVSTSTSPPILQQPQAPLTQSPPAVEKQPQGDAVVNSNITGTAASTAYPPSSSQQSPYIQEGWSSQSSQPRHVSSTTPNPAQTSDDATGPHYGTDQHRASTLPAPPAMQRSVTAPFLTPLDTFATYQRPPESVWQDDDGCTVDSHGLGRNNTLVVPLGSLLFPVPRPSGRPRALSTSAIASPSEVSVIESSLSSVAGYERHYEAEQQHHQQQQQQQLPHQEHYQQQQATQPPLEPQPPTKDEISAPGFVDPFVSQAEIPDIPDLESQQGHGPSRSSTSSSGRTTTTLRPISTVSAVSTRSQIPYTGYTEDHIIPLFNDATSGQPPSAKTNEREKSPPRLAIEAATPQTPTRVPQLPVPKRGSLTNIAGIFSSFRPSSSPLNNSSQAKATASVETYASARVRLKREKMSLDMAMRRKAQRDGLLSPQRDSPLGEDMSTAEDWQKELRALEAEKRERTLRNERRRSFDFKEQQRKQKSEMVRNTFGWQFD